MDIIVKKNNKAKNLSKQDLQNSMLLKYTSLTI